MHKRKPIKTKINLNKTILKGKFVFVYAGNFGKSQQVENLLNIASVFKENKKFGFLFIGNGSEFDRIKDTVKCNLLGNILMLNQVPACELISLYKQCNFGLITLNLRHSTHNTPGKFISYLLSGLPTIAIVNKGNDLIEIINRNNLGIAYSFKNTRFLEKKLLKFIGSINKKKLVSNCISFANKNYSPKKAAIQIINLYPHS